eukprot:4744552-Prymnesium_polylepis.2
MKPAFGALRAIRATRSLLLWLPYLHSYALHASLGSPRGSACPAPRCGHAPASAAGDKGGIREARRPREQRQPHAAALLLPSRARTLVRYPRALRGPCAWVPLVGQLLLRARLGLPRPCEESESHGVRVGRQRADDEAHHVAQAVLAVEPRYAAEGTMPLLDGRRLHLLANVDGHDRVDDRARARGGRAAHYRGGARGRHDGVCVQVRGCGGAVAPVVPPRPKSGARIHACFTLVRSLARGAPRRHARTLHSLGIPTLVCTLDLCDSVHGFDVTSVEYLPEDDVQAALAQLAPAVKLVTGDGSSIIPALVAAMSEEQ